MKLPILQKTYNIVKWYVPIINRIPKNQKYLLGDRLITSLYNFLEGLIHAQYSREKLLTLTALNTQLEVIRYQTRLLHDFTILPTDRYEHVAKLINEIGTDLGGWIKQQTRSPLAPLDKGGTGKEPEKPISKHTITLTKTNPLTTTS